MVLLRRYYHCTSPLLLISFAVVNHPDTEKYFWQAIKFIHYCAHGRTINSWPSLLGAKIFLANQLQQENSFSNTMFISGLFSCLYWAQIKINCQDISYLSTLLLWQALGFWIVEGSGVVEEIFLSPLTTIAALFCLHASYMYGKMFLASFSVTDLI